MIKKIKPVIFLMLCFLLFQSASGQVKKNMTDYLTQKFSGYSNAVPREEIFVHSDRDDYIAGEDIWFNLYLIDRQSNKPIGTDRIAYLELLNPENLPIIQKRILLDKGFGPGQFVLPDTLSSGSYTLRAYTSWMKNFLPYNCFMKEIRIYNALSAKAFREKVYTDSGLKNEMNSREAAGTTGSGLTLRINNFKADTLEIILNSEINYRSINKNTVYLFIQTHGLLNHVSAEKIISDITTIIIPKKELIPGINHITIFDSKGLPVVERFIYTPDRISHSLLLNAGDSYKTRDKVTLDMSLGDYFKNASDATNLSISVSPFSGETEKMELSDYMVFGSEFGLLPQLALNGKKIGDISPYKLDSLLSKVKSNWIVWGKILSDNLPVFKYQVESRYHYITGKLLSPDQKATGTEEYLFLSTPEKIPEFQYARTDLQGNFSFKINIDESVKDLIIQPDNVTNKNKISVESSFPDQYYQNVVSSDAAGKTIPQFISKLAVNYQVNKIYETSYIGDRLIPAIKPASHKRFYGKPQIELIMSDYIKLPVMQEVFF